MSVANITVEKTTDFGKIIGKTLIALWIGFIAFGESAGRARAAAELSRQGYTEAAKNLMLENK